MREGTDAAKSEQNAANIMAATKKMGEWEGNFKTIFLLNYAFDNA